MLWSSAGPISVCHTLAFTCPRIVPSVNPVPRRLIPALDRPIFGAQRETSVGLHEGLIAGEQNAALMAELKAISSSLIDLPANLIS